MKSVFFGWQWLNSSPKECGWCFLIFVMKPMFSVTCFMVFQRVWLQKWHFESRNHFPGGNGLVLKKRLFDKLVILGDTVISRCQMDSSCIAYLFTKAQSHNCLTLSRGATSFKTFDGNRVFLKIGEKLTMPFDFIHKHKAIAKSTSQRFWSEFRTNKKNNKFNVFINAFSLSFFCVMFIFLQVWIMEIPMCMWTLTLFYLYQHQA